MRNKRAFTIAELLIVIAIISILAAIMFPIFSAAHEKARQTTCLSNEKQLGSGLMLYTQDYDNTFAPLIIENFKQPRNFVYWPFLIYPYVKGNQAFYCPDDPDKPKSSVHGMRACASGNGFCDEQSYGMNVDLNLKNAGKGQHSYGIQLNNVQHPSELLTFVEVWSLPVPGQCYGAYFQGYLEGPSAGGPYGGPTAWYSGGAGTPVIADRIGPKGKHFNSFFVTPYARHFGGADVAYVDGHVNWLTFDQLYNPPTGTDPVDFRLWHPDAQ